MKKGSKNFLTNLYSANEALQWLMMGGGGTPQCKWSPALVEGGRGEGGLAPDAPPLLSPMSTGGEEHSGGSQLFLWSSSSSSSSSFWFMFLSFQFLSETSQPATQPRPDIRDLVTSRIEQAKISNIYRFHKVQDYVIIIDDFWKMWWLSALSKNPQETKMSKGTEL